MVAGVVIFFLFTALGVAYTGGFYSEYFPMQDVRSYPKMEKEQKLTTFRSPTATTILALATTSAES
jgi:hypothetical protein